MPRRTQPPLSYPNCEEGARAFALPGGLHCNPLSLEGAGLAAVSMVTASAALEGAMEEQLAVLLPGEAEYLVRELKSFPLRAIGDHGYEERGSQGIPACEGAWHGVS